MPDDSREWISISDSLPEIGETCLVYCGIDYRGDRSICHVCEHEGGNSWFTDVGDMLESDVSHWMPLPLPPTEATANA